MADIIEVIEIEVPGERGPAGIVYRGVWVLGTAYDQYDAYYHNGSTFIALVGHVATALTEPGVGVDWATVQNYLAVGAESEALEIVAGAIDAINTVAGAVGAVTTVSDNIDAVADVASIAAQVGTVAGIAAQVGTVAGIADAIDTTADIATQINQVATIRDDVSTVADASSNVAIVAGNIDYIETVAGIAPQLGQVVAIRDDIVDVANIASAVQIVASMQLDISTVAGMQINIAALAPLTDEIAQLAALSSQIYTVANLSTEIIAIYAIRGDISIVASRNAEIIALSGVIDEIVALAPIANQIKDIGDNIDAVLDAKNQADRAENAASAAAADKEVVAGLKLSVEGLKAAVDVAYQNMLTALANVTNYNNTLGQLDGAWKQLVSAADVAASAIYDTTKDPDCGLWRFWKVRRASWYNEPLNTTTRGSRQGFPQKVGIVARAGSVTLYDLDDAACPMWMVFNIGGSDTTQALIGRSGDVINSVAAACGYLYVGSTPSNAGGGIRIADFIGDGGSYIRASTGSAGTYRGRIADRNANLGFAGATTTIVNSTVNSVATYVAPGTPRDFARAGLPTPTIAVATAGGVSVIHPDGRVTNSVSTNVMRSVWFDERGTLWYYYDNSALSFSPRAEYWTTAFIGRLYANTTSPALLGISLTTSSGSAGGGIIVRPVGAAPGLGPRGIELLRHEPGSGIAGAQNNRSSVAYITRDFNTGWMTGNTLMALAESTRDQTNLVGHAALADDFSSYADTAAMVAGGWVNISDGSGAVTLASGKIRVSNGSGSSDIARTYRTMTGLIVGATYRIWATLSNAGAGFKRIHPSTSSAFTNTSSSINATSNGLYVFDFVATAATMYFHIFNSNLSSAAGDWDDIRVDLVSQDRSAANNRPVIVGTVGRTPVAANAELCAYTGFSASNYLELPYSSAFDFGLLDWSVSFAARRPAGSNLAECLFARRAWNGSAYTGAGWDIHLGTGGAPIFSVTDDGYSTVDQVTSAVDLRDGRWHTYTVGRRGNFFILVLDGIQVASTVVNNANLSLSNASATLRIGVTQAGVNPATTSSIAQFRVSASMPTPAQIRQAYADEAPMFLPGAKILLTGSNVVQNVAFDRANGTWYAAQAAGGTDVFNDLCRVGTVNPDSENGYGSELFPGYVTPGTNWIINNPSSITHTPGSVGSITSANFTTQTIGDWYRVSLTISSATAGTVSPRFTGAATQVINAGISGNGTFTYYLQASAANNQLNMLPNTAFDGTIMAFSVKKITNVRMTSDNHKAVSAENDNVLITTANEVYVSTPSIRMREQALKESPRVPYDRNSIKMPSAAVTTNVVSTIIGYIPIAKDESFQAIIATTAKEYDGTAYASFIDTASVYRPGEGNIVGTLGTQTIVSRSAAGITVTVSFNTTLQAIQIAVTGENPKNLEWGYEVMLRPTTQQVAA